MRFRKSQVFSALLAAAVLTVGGCSSAGSAADQEVATPSASPTDDPGVTDAQTTSEQEPATQTATEAPPSEEPGGSGFASLEPDTPQAGKSVFVITTSMGLEGNARQVDSAQEAAAAIGWTTTVVDANFQPSEIASGIRRAISEKADAIIIDAIDYGSNAAAIDEARAAGILVMSIVSGNTYPDQVDYEVTYDQHESGVVAAEYAIQHSPDGVNILALNDTLYTLVGNEVDGVTSTCEQASGCEVGDELKFTGDQVGPDLLNLVQTSLTTHPEVNWVVTPYGATEVFVREAIQRASSGAKVIGVSSNNDAYDAIRAGDTPQAATVAAPLEYLSYLAIYDLSLMMQGKTPVHPAVPLEAIDATNLPPSGEAWTGDTPYRAPFEAAWGITIASN